MVSEELTGAEKYFEMKERCVWCDILRQERRDGTRLILEEGGFVALALRCGSLCAVGSTAPGSAIGGPGLRLVGSAVTIGLRPVTSPRAIAITPLKPDGAMNTAKPNFWRGWDAMRRDEMRRDATN